MKHLMTQKFIFGLLIALVLAFGVQGVVEALTLTATSSVSQSARMGSTFEMSFRVGLNNPKDINDFNSNSRHIKAQVADRQYAAGERIRSNVAVSRTVDAGWTAGDTDYYTTSAVDTTTVVGLAITTTTRNWGISRSDDADLPAGKTWTSGDLTDRQYAAEERIRSNVAVSRTVDAGWTAGDTDYYTTSAVDTTTVAGLAITTTTRNWVTESNAFYYNDEAIEFWIERTGNPDGVTPAGTLKLKRPSYVLPGRSDDESGSTTTDVSTRSLQERVDIGLPSTISLVYEDATVGIHRIKVWDATPLVDFPPDAVPSNNRPRARTTFTLRVTPSSTDIAESDNIGPGNQRIPVQDAVVPVSAELTVTPTTGNHRIRYEIVKGSGSLYVGTLEEEYTRPSSTLSVHQGSNVYLKTNNSSNEVHVWFAGEDRTAPRATIVFEYRGQALPTTRTPTTTPTTPTPTPVSTTPSLTLSSTTISGAAGSSQTVTATVQRGTSLAPGIAVTFQVGSLTPVVLSTNTSGQVSHTFTLPSADTTLTVSANVLGTPVSASATLDVTGTTDTTDTTDDTTPVQVPTDIRIDGDDEQTGEPNRRLPDDLVVRVVDANGDGVSGERVSFSIVSGRGRLSPARTFTDSDGYADVGFTPQSAGTIEIEASTGNLRPVTFTITTGEPPDAITIVSGTPQSGRPGARLANPFVVQVIDRNDDPVSGVSVSFSVTAGGGSVSPTSATTNNNGRAQTTLTLGDDPGENTVRASVTGVSPVTFKATSGAEVLLNASQRPPMYWISRNEGKLYRLVDDEIESLAPNLTGITNVAVDAANNVLYLSVQTGENRGDIRRANLNGGNVRTLKTITAVPRGITVDATGDTLYWANSRGRIQSMQTAGSTKLTNVLENLRNPTIVVSNGHLYWTESIGRIRRIDLTDAQLTIQNIATGLGEPLGLSVAKGKVYWIERNADGSGSLNRSNLDGSNAQALKTFASGVPTSLAVDSADNKIYWTKGAGKIQRSNLAGKFVRDVASGLMGPTGIALSIAVTDGTTAVATPGTRNTQQTNNDQTTFSRYDINRDGAVNNADTRAVAAAIGQSGADIANPRTDVDGNGMVDVTDIILVLGNLDDDVAAPTLAIDMKALDIDFDRVQEQVEVLLASSDASIAAQRALLYLQHLLASARPDETVLLANYPNPFNPETWIPYHLAESTDVKINIYDAQGVLVRALTVGHQSAGYYTSRSRAAYWDGRNAFGERVASGIYFYQLETDEMSPLRKMVILK